MPLAETYGSFERGDAKKKTRFGCHKPPFGKAAHAVASRLFAAQTRREACAIAVNHRMNGPVGKDGSAPDRIGTLQPHALVA
jgi:hypothetical protein